MKSIVTDTYTFSNLRERGCLYVDKTAILHRLVTGLPKQFFFARPRRFGKSLTISTLEAIFEGRRELFEGLAIDKTDYDWKKYPVVRLDMGSCQAETVDEFHIKLSHQLKWAADDNGLPHDANLPVDVQFSDLCKAAAAKSEHGKFVLLIDEYDKPLLGHLMRPTVEAFRSALKSFYSVIKTTEKFQRFAFITGVSKFSKVSIFSDLNNLTDITLSREAATLCGYTHEEVAANFSEHIAALGAENNMTPEAAFEAVLKWYNGYRFHAAAETVVNPVSLGRCLMDREFKCYWYETGTPTFLVNILKANPLDISNLEITEADLGTYEPSNPAIAPLLFQTGYLTIRDFVQIGGMRSYTLGFPNSEVRDAFNSSLVNVYTGRDSITLGRAQLHCARALLKGDTEAFLETTKLFFADIPYNLTDRSHEQTWQVILYTILRFIGVCVETEIYTNTGRIDAVIETDSFVYVIEIKLDKTAADALAQIKEKGYADKYHTAGKRITLIGMNFSSTKRTIDAWEVEEV